MDKVAGTDAGPGTHPRRRLLLVSCTLQLVASHGGWRLIDDGEPSFWFLERAQAIHHAELIADARANLRFIPTRIEATNDSGKLELVASFP